MTAEQLPAAAVVPCGFGGSVTSHDRQSRSGGGTDLEVEPEPAGVTADRGVGGAGGLRRSLAPVHRQVRQAPSFRHPYPVGIPNRGHKHCIQALVHTQPYTHIWYRHNIQTRTHTTDIYIHENKVAVAVR